MDWGYNSSRPFYRVIIFPTYKNPYLKLELQNQSGIDFDNLVVHTVPPQCFVCFFIFV